MMNKPINEILNFNFDAEKFAQKAESSITNTLKKQQEKNIKVLNQLTEQLGNLSFESKTTVGIEKVFEKTIALLKNDDDLNGKFDNREIRILTCALDYKPNYATSILAETNYLQHCIQLISNNWNNRLIDGLLRCYFKNWNSEYTTSIEVLSKFVLEKIDTYGGKREKYLNLKSQIKFFAYKKGDIDLGYTLALLKKPIHQANIHISLPDNWLAYPYFYGVINAYVEKTKNEVKTHFNDLTAFLYKHSNQTKGTFANKIIMSKIICYSKEIDDDNFRNQLKDETYKLVGDPGVKWIVNNATEKDITIVNEARGILNEWLTRQFINVFFEKCINDVRRKEFWLKYTTHISAFKVIGPKTLKYVLEQDERIGKYVENRFSVTNSSKNVSAMVMNIKNHVLLEFSDEGYAFIGYKKDNPIINKFNEVIKSVDDLREPGLRTADTNDLSEGRLIHRDEWEHNFSWWIERHVL